RTSRRRIPYGNETLDLHSEAGRRRLNDLFSTSFEAVRSDDDRQGILSNLAELLEVQRPMRRDLDDDLRFVTPDDLARLGSSSLLTVGSHAMSHRFLDGLPYEQQLYE